MSRPLISERTMTKVRAISERAMPDFCTVFEQRRETTADGGWTTTPVPRFADRCAVSRSNATPTDQTVAGRVQGRTLYTVRLPWHYAADVESSDRVTVEHGAEPVALEILGTPMVSAFDASLTLSCVLAE